MADLTYVIEICVGIDVAILGIAYPITVDKITSIGEKYSSEYLSKVFFLREFPHRQIKILFFEKRQSVFKVALIVTILSFCLLLYPFKSPFEIDNLLVRWIINNSANLIVIIMTVGLITLFIKWLEKLILFNGKSSDLIQHLIGKYRIEKIEEVKIYYLKTINEFAYYAIEKQDEHIGHTLREFYFSVFADIHRLHEKNEPLEYDNELYELVYRLNVACLENNNRKLRGLEHRAVSGWWLLGMEFEKVIISETTYYHLWVNLSTVIERSTFVRMYWGTADQYYKFRLARLTDDFYGSGFSLEKAKGERDRYLEFHFALGGLLLYRNQYETIHYITNYSQSIPPDYPLLPQNMDEIFFWFEHFRNEHKNFTNPIERKYFFPDLDNLGSNHQIKYWICSYLCLLFIRQYSLLPHLITQRFIDQPRLPDKIVELNNWLTSLQFFEKCLSDVVERKELIHQMGFENLIDQKQSDFEVFLADLKKNIIEKIKSVKASATLEKDKIQQFYVGTKAILSRAFDKYKAIFNPDRPEGGDKYLRMSINGEHNLMPKAVFTNGEMDHLNYDTIFAEQLEINSVNQYLMNSFFAARTRRYLLPQDKLDDAFQRAISGNSNAVIIVIRPRPEVERIIANSKFQDRFIRVPSAPYTDIQNLLFIMDRSDLPYIEHKDLSTEEITEYHLEEIDDERKIYASVIDINTIENSVLKQKMNLAVDQSELQVLITIAFLAIICWKEDRDVIQINIIDQYREQGIQNEVNDIIPLANKG